VLYDKVLEYADLNGDEIVFDLYSGIGTIALYLANKAKMVYGIESVEQAVDNAGKNAVLNGIKNVEFVAGRVQDVLPEFMGKGIKTDLIVLDPPRKGCNKRALDMLHELGVSKVVYVSCNSSNSCKGCFVFAEQWV
jgi:23S rRNA (uracil1939-C5)-methyltransferase